MPDLTNIQATMLLYMQSTIQEFNSTASFAVATGCVCARAGETIKVNTHSESKHKESLNTSRRQHTRLLWGPMVQKPLKHWSV